MGILIPWALAAAALLLAAGVWSDCRRAWAVNRDLRRDLGDRSREVLGLRRALARERRRARKLGGAWYDRGRN